MNFFFILLDKILDFSLSFSFSSALGFENICNILIFIEYLRYLFQLLFYLIIFLSIKLEYKSKETNKNDIGRFENF